MGLRINHNVLALGVYRNLLSTQNKVSKAVEALSSGLRINQSWDDPMNLGVSERFRAQIAGMVEAERNANGNINLLATADGALSVIDEKLIRMRALAIQASNGALTSIDRMVANVEYQQLKSEITRIAKSTAYNGLKLIDGSFSATNLSTATCLALGYNAASTSLDNGLKFHIGPNNIIGEDYYYVNLGNMTSYALGIGATDICNIISAQTAIDAIDAAINSKDVERAFIGSMVERLQNSIMNLQISQEAAVTSESFIRDTDVAQQMMEFTRAQILTQSGLAMLAQANQMPSAVAQLLG